MRIHRPWIAGIAAFSRIAAGAPPDEPRTKCPVQIVPTDAPKEWQDAARRLERDEPSTDCGSVVVEIDDRGATIVFATKDGRQAVRHVESAGAVVPTIAALAVTENIPAPVERTESSVASAPRLRDAPPPYTPVVHHRSDLHFVGALLGGARLGAPGIFGAPSFGVRVGLLLRRWEIGVRGDWEPILAIAGSSPSPARYEVSAIAGRRETAGIFAFPWGVSGGVVVTDQGAQNQQNDSPTVTADALVGAYVGVVIPARSRVRVRAELVTDVALVRLARAGDPSQPLLPWFGLGVSVGIEGSLP